jgi:hypothetical protein
MLNEFFKRGHLDFEIQRQMPEVGEKGRPLLSLNCAHGIHFRLPGFIHVTQLTSELAVLRTLNRIPTKHEDINLN